MPNSETSTDLSLWIEKHLKPLGHSLKNPARLAAAILKTSQHYQDPNSVSPWASEDFKAAYLSYYHPLNRVRLERVVTIAKAHGFFDDLDFVLDYGCGLGAASRVLCEQGVTTQNLVGLDQDPLLKNDFLDGISSSATMSFQTQWPAIPNPKSLIVASYVLNELESPPPQLFSFERVMILEPSTKQAFKKLSQVREQLIAAGYQILAPCPHHGTCPLSLSPKDWCHDRVHWQAPDWFKGIEKHLPMKNRTLTFSYLLASRLQRPVPPHARIVGDPLVEKGKTRWLLCENSDRQFLSHLKRQGRAPNLQRGDAVQISGAERKGHGEIRYQTIEKIDR